MENTFLQPQYFAVAGCGTGEKQKWVQGAELPSHSVFCSTPAKSLHLQVSQLPDKLEVSKKKKSKNLKMNVSICLITSGLC